VAQGDGEAVAWLDAIVESIRAIHDLILEMSGGLAGIHDDKLYSACARPFQTAFGERLFTTPLSQAAALMHGIITGHVFADGNKRTATIVMVEYLAATGVVAGPPTRFQTRLLGELAVEVASTKMDVAEWPTGSRASCASMRPRRAEVRRYPAALAVSVRSSPARRASIHDAISAITCSCSGSLRISW
jgi:prophage maintenance system killer protein